MSRFVLLCAMALCCVAGLSARSPRRMQELIDAGKDCLFRPDPRPDSAVVFFSTVADSYTPGMSMRQKELCATALNNLGFTYFHYLIDYRHAYESLTRAEKICAETGKVLTTVNVKLNLGNIYSVFSEHVESPEIAAEAETMYIDAFETARANGLWHQMLTAFSNITTMRNDLSGIDRFSRIIEDFGRTDIPATTPNYRFCRLRYAALRALQSGDMAAATDSLRASMYAINSDMTVEASHCQALTLMSAIFRLRQMPDSAIVYANRLYEYATRYDVPEARANANRLLEQCYLAAGDTVAASEAHYRFVVVQDSLINNRQLGAIDNLKFLNELASEKEKADRVIAEAERKEKVREVVVFFALLLLAVALPLLLVILNRHRMLRASYRELYDRYQGTLAREDQQRISRETEVREAAARPAASYTVPRDALSNKTRILAVMDGSPEIFNPDFSLERLAELTDMKPRVLSAIINDSFGLTFRDLLNSYRVREACRRLTDVERYGNLTIEAISMSVGYRSRTSLISAFKRETGLTPSEYQKIARQG